jgi:DNA-directed RNA polymerase II subunit RPB3
MGFPGAVEIEQRQDCFLFTVETTGVLKPAEIVLNALDALKEKLEAVLEDIEGVH